MGVSVLCDVVCNTCNTGEKCQSTIRGAYVDDSIRQSIQFGVRLELIYSPRQSEKNNNKNALFSGEKAGKKVVSPRLYNIHKHTQYVNT